MEQLRHLQCDKNGQLDAVSHVKLVDQNRYVVLDGLLADAEPIPDFAVGVPGRDRSQNRHFSRR